MNQGVRLTGVFPAAALAAALWALGCPGTLPDKQCYAQEDRARTILVAKCASSGCHSAKSPSTGLDLESPNIGARLSGKATLSCNGKLVVPGDPDASVLYNKLMDPPPCGSRMPLAKPELADADKELIRVWIAGLDGSCKGEGTTSGSGGATGSTGGTGGATATGGAGGTTTTTATAGAGGTTTTATAGAGGTTASGGAGGTTGSGGMGGM